MPPEDTFGGDRFSMYTDPFGHSWAMVTVKEELTPKTTLGDRMREFVAQKEQEAPMVSGREDAAWNWACGGIDHGE